MHHPQLSIDTYPFSRDGRSGLAASYNPKKKAARSLSDRQPLPRRWW
jgi:hypothetical protein